MGWNFQMKVNPTRIREVMVHPVNFFVWFSIHTNQKLSTTRRILAHLMILLTSLAKDPFWSILLSWLASQATYLWHGGSVTSCFLNACASSNIIVAKSGRNREATLIKPAK